MGKPNSENVQDFATTKLVIGLNIPIIKGQADSVSGLRHALKRVGVAAKPSLAMAKIIAKFGSLVIYQRRTAAPDSIPHK